jgi:hypothetical protein
VPLVLRRLLLVGARLVPDFDPLRSAPPRAGIAKLQQAPDEVKVRSLSKSIFCAAVTKMPR